MRSFGAFMVMGLGGLFCFLVGCDQPARELPQEEEAPQSSTEMPLSAVPGLSSDRFDRELAEELVRVDPAKDGWGTEVISEKILQQLKQLELWMQGARAGEPPITLAADFQGATAREEAFQNVYQGDTFQIKRTRQSVPVDRKTWLENWPRSVGRAFKVIQVTPLANQEVRVILLVDESTGEEEEHAVWKTFWRVTNDDTFFWQGVEIGLIERVTRATSKALFADATGTVLGDEPAYLAQLAYGIDHWRDRLDWRFGLEVTGPHGLALGDVNGDGRDDVYVCEPGGLPNRLFVQEADGSARERSAMAGIDFLESTQSALFLDLDNDGDQDLVVGLGRFVFFYANDGQATFTQKAVAQSDAVARSQAAADYDHDGDLDLYVCGYHDRSGDSVGLGRPMPYHDANNGAKNHLLANLGNWRFQDMTEVVGLDMNNRRFSYAAAWEDFDNDGDPDLYVANDFGRNNLYQNNGGTFVDIAAQAGVEDLSAGMSVSWADYNQDGLMDVYVGNMFSSAGNRIAYQRQYRAGLPDATPALQRHARGNSLFQNLGDGTFEDVSMEAGVNMGRWAWSSLFADVNNDSHEDLLIANGMVTSVEDSGDL